MHQPLIVEYYAIKIITANELEYWFTDKDNDFTLAENEFIAKLFHSHASAKRFLDKLRLEYPDMDQKFLFNIIRLGIQ